MDTALEGSLNFAFSPQFGYLTACPTNVGTGLRISVMMHLPAAVLSKRRGRASGQPRAWLLCPLAAA